jgi:hypothetical protein
VRREEAVLGRGRAKAETTACMAAVLLGCPDLTPLRVTTSAIAMRKRRSHILYLPWGVDTLVPPPLLYSGEPNQ